MWITTKSSASMTHFSSATSQMAYDNAVSKSAPFAITTCADRTWSHHAPHLLFGCTYHSWFPMNWSQQVLGMMINSSFAQHLYTSICLERQHSNLTMIICYSGPLSACHRPVIAHDPASYYEPLQGSDRFSATSVG